MTIKFTREEIDLAKQIAMIYQGEVRKGDWLIYEDADRRTGWSNPILNDRDNQHYGSGKNALLWQVHDCLNWLVNKGYDKIMNFMFFSPDKWTFTAESFILNTPYKKVRGEGLTRRAACMATVLAVVKEEG